jgi:hypothetical protein
MERIAMSESCRSKTNWSEENDAGEIREKIEGSFSVRCLLRHSLAFTLCLFSLSVSTVLSVRSFFRLLPESTSEEIEHEDEFEYEDDWKTRARSDSEVAGKR